MLLPCPHCKRRFKLAPDRIPAGGAKLKCPACKGHFFVDTSPLRRSSDPPPPPAVPGTPPEPVHREAPPSPSAGNGEPCEGASPGQRFPSLLWLMVAVSGLLVALIGILAPIVWESPPASVKKAALEGPSSSCALGPPASKQAKGASPTDETAQQTEGKKAEPVADQAPPTYRSLWPFSPVDKQKSCEFLAQLKDPGQGKTAEEALLFYAPWIAYLSLETSPSPACETERAFRIATDAIANRQLCGRGYAFLAAYYAYKRVLDRARSFLEEALEASPKDPWVRLVEGMFSERVLRDSEQAVRILSGVLRKEPSFALAQYHLAKIYLDEEEYGKAKELFAALETSFPEQRGFRTIRESLARIEPAPYFSPARAKGLLEVSRALSGLMDYPLAGRLCRTVLESMPGSLPREEKKSAFYDLGRISELTGDKETAFSCYQNALRIDPFYRDARERLGSILRTDAQTS